jgi:hypothetical protein
MVQEVATKYSINIEIFVMINIKLINSSDLYTQIDFYIDTSIAAQVKLIYQVTLFLLSVIQASTTSRQ